MNIAASALAEQVSRASARAFAAESQLENLRADNAYLSDALRKANELINRLAESASKIEIYTDEQTQMIVAQLRRDIAEAEVHP
jgi:hypothetical protein